MGRKVFLEENAFAQCNEKLQSATYSEVGLLVGQMSSSRDLAFGLIPTPCAENQTGVIKTMGLQDIDEQWIGEHSKQIIHLLPGGLFVIGVYIIASTDLLKNRDAQIQQLVLSVAKTRNLKLQPNETIYLHICSRTKKMTCKSYDTTKGTSSSGWPADIKTQSFMDAVHLFKADYNFTLEISVSTMNIHPLGQQVQEQLTNIETRVENALLGIDGKILSIDTQADVPETLEKYIKGSSKKALSDHNVQFWDPLSQTVQQEELSAPSLLLIAGVATSITLINSKEEIGIAIQMIKKDVADSIRRRFELLFEELQQGSEEDPFQQTHYPTNDTLWVLPKRIYAKYPSGLYLCDYLFPSETPQDCQARVMELTSLNSAESLEWLWNIEEFPPEKGEFYASKMKSRIFKSAHQTHKATKTAPQPSKASLQKNTPLQHVETKSQGSYTLIALISILVVIISVYFATVRS